MKHALGWLLGLGVAALAFPTAGCGDSTATGGGGDGGAGTTSTATSQLGVTVSSGTTGPGNCDSDPLETGLVAMQTGVSVDSFDCEVLTAAAKYGEPDPMIFKAIIYVESRFDDTSVACPNMPCGVPSGWTADETGCFGLMQVVPACGPTPGNEGLLASGQPNLTKDSSDPGWSSSIFYPAINIDDGVSGIAGNRKQVKSQFSGCTEEQYTLMAVGNYNSYGSTKSCTEYNTDYDGPVLAAYDEYSKAAGYAEKPYPTD